MLQWMVQQPMHRLSRLDSEELEVGRELGCGKLEAVEGGNGGNMIKQATLHKS